MARETTTYELEQGDVELPDTGRPVIRSTRGVISSGHYLTSMAGMRILLSDGNAFDALAAAGLDWSDWDAAGLDFSKCCLTRSLTCRGTSSESSSGSVDPAAAKESSSACSGGDPLSRRQTQHAILGGLVDLLGGSHPHTREHLLTSSCR